jgi:uncharacterized membrane protein YphA (DoxX/SURF4 family)
MAEVERVEGTTPARTAHLRSRVTGHTLAAQQMEAWLLRLGLAFVLLYASAACLFDPLRFSAFMPDILPGSIEKTVCLPAFSAFEAVLALCLLTGRRLCAAALLTAATMTAIVIVNPDEFGVLFRNVAIAFAALSLAVHERARPERWDCVVAPTTGTSRQPTRDMRLGAKR